MGKVYDKTSGMIRTDLSGEELQNLVLQGKADVLKGETYDVVTRDGKRGSFTDPKLLLQALKQGRVRFEGRSEAMAAEAENQGLRTFVENTLSGFSMGASDALGKALSTATTTDPLEIQSRQKQFVDETNIRAAVNPGLATTGQIAGTLASALVPGGPLAQVGKGAKIAGSAVQHGTRLGRLGGAVAREGIEGAAFGLGSAISEASLGDPDEFAEYLLADVGMGFAFGAGLPVFGSAARATGRGAAKLLPSRAKDAVALYAKQSGQTAGKALVKGYDALASKVRRLQGRIIGADAKFLDEAASLTPRGRMIREKLLGRKKPDVQVIQKLTSLSDETEKIVDRASRRAVGSFKKKRVAEVFAKEQVDVGRAAAVADDLFARIEGQADDMLADEVSYGFRADLRRTKKLAAQMRKKIRDADDAASLYAELDDAKRLLADNAKFDRNLRTMSSRDVDSAVALQGLHRELKSNLESTELWGSVGSMQAEVNSSGKQLLGTNKEYRKHFMTQAQGGFVHDPGKVNTFVNGITGVKGDLKMQSLIARRDAQKKLIQTIEDHYDLDDAGRLALRELKQKTDETTALIGEIEENLTVHNKFEELVKAERDSLLEKVVPTLGVGNFAWSVYHGDVDPGDFGLLAAAAFLRPSSAIKLLGQLERHGGRAAARLASGVKKFAGTTAKAVKKTTKPAASKALIELRSKSGEERRRAYEKIQQEIREAKMQMETMVDSVGRSMGRLSEEAPRVSAAVTHKALLALNVLSEDLPGKNFTATEAFGGPHVPAVSQADIDRFQRRLEGVEDPLSILDDMDAGTLSPEKVRAVKTAYPKLFEEMGVQILEELSVAQAEGKEVSYQKRIQLGLVFDQPTDESLKPEFVRAMVELSAQRQKERQSNRGGYAPSRMTPVSISNQPQAAASDQIISRK